MRKNIRDLAVGFFSLGLLIFVFGSYVIVAQTSAMTGTWTAKPEARSPEKIHLSFSRESAKGNRNQHGSDFDYADLQGLSRNQPNGKVNFRLVREAGNIECEGTFTDGRGSGTFVYTPNRAFVDGMANRGFTFKQEQLFSAAMLNLTTAFTDDLKSANFGPLGVEDLFSAVIFKITPQFAAEMKATGFPNLGMEDLVQARIFKIDADYVKQVSDMGLVKEDFEGLVNLRIFKVTPEFMNELKNVGFANLSSEDVVQFRIFNISPEFARDARAKDPNISVKDLVEMKIGVRRK